MSENYDLVKQQNHYNLPINEEKFDLIIILLTK
jgi:hypothetical protein